MKNNKESPAKSAKSKKLILTINAVPEQTMGALRNKSKLEKRSMSAQALIFLEQGLCSVN